MQSHTQNPQNPLTIQDIVVVGIGGGNPSGEFKDSNARNETTSSMLDRLYKHIEALASGATDIHRQMNCQPNSNKLKSKHKNNITRLVTNEFYFYTSNPLDLVHFQTLQNKLFDLAKKLPNNLVLVLATFAVKTPYNKIMNVVARVECGDKPNFNFIVKNHPSVIDPIYSETLSNQKKPLPNVDIQTNDAISHLKIKIKNKFYAFTYNNVFACKTADDLDYFECIDICADYLGKVAKKNLDNELIVMLKEAESKKKFKSFPILFSPIVVANSLGLKKQFLASHPLGITTFADPREKLTINDYKIGIGAYPEKSFDEFTQQISIFGTPQKIIVTHPAELEILSLMTRPAYLAAKSGHSYVLDTFLKYGLDPNMSIVGTDSKTLLATALKYNQVDIIKLLLATNMINIDEPYGKYQNTQLHIAAKKNQENLAFHYLEFGANINSKNIHGKTPLMLAIQNEKPKMVKFLLKNGADPNLKDKGGNTPLYHSLCLSPINDKITDAILDEINIDAKDARGMTELHRAVLMENTIVVRELLTYYAANPFIMDNNGDTPLDIAVRSDYTEIACDLIASSVVALGNSGKALLIEATINQNNVILNALIRQGANPNMHSRQQGMTALHIASAKNSIETIKYLLQAKNIEINPLDQTKSTPLHLAVKNRHYDTVNLLLKNGARLNIKNIAGLTPLGLAAKDGNLKLVKHLFENIKHKLTSELQLRKFGLIKAFHEAAKQGHVNIVSYFLGNGISPDAKLISGDNASKTLLMKAVARNQPELIEMLLKQGANLNLQDDQGKTALQIAEKMNNPQLIAQLKKYSQPKSTATSVSFFETKPVRKPTKAVENMHNQALLNIKLDINKLIQNIQINYKISTDIINDFMAPLENPRYQADIQIEQTIKALSKFLHANEDAKSFLPELNRISDLCEKEGLMISTRHLPTKNK